MIATRWAAFHGKRVLLLQGPVGPFFWRLANVLRSVGAEVYKINFNGGDCLFYPLRAFCWRGPPEEWEEYFASRLQQLRIDVVMLFGDCRPLHRKARDIAHARGVKVGVFEEGYVRPNYITFEQYGVNGYSLIPRSPDFYRELPISPMLPERRVGNTFWCAALWAASYYVAGSLLYPFFRRYRHHRPLTLLEAWPWVRGAWRKVTYRWKERRVMSLLTGPLTKKFFLVPLQMCVDSQVRQHSNFTSVAEFIQHVVASFAEHAPADAVLVVKHHPLDRGYHDYSQMLRKLSRQLRVSDRLLYIHDQHLPTVCEHARGAVVINSTVGLSVLTHSAALKVCGDAIYDLHGLTFQRSLDEFWREADQVRPDMELFERFRSYLIDHTQLNGSFYLGAIDANLSASMASAHEVERRAHSQRSGLPIPSSQT